MKKNIDHLLAKIYKNFKLNLGIKTFLSNFFILSKSFYDEHIIFKLHKKIEKYVFDQTIKHYGADYRWNDEKSQNLDKKNNNYGYGLFHYSVVRNQRPKRILCVGSMYGFIPYMLAKGCEENKFGKVDFVDAGYDLEDKNDKEVHYFGQGFWKKETVKKHFSYFLDSKYIDTHIMTTKNFLKKFPKNTYDYICLDGDHSYKGAKFDFDNFWPKLNKGGFISFHDIHLEPEFLKKEAQKIKIEFGYKKFWQEICETKKFKFELSNHYSGLGFLQKN